MKKLSYLILSLILITGSVFAADVSQFSNTDASNNNTPPNGFPENMAPSQINDGARALMGALARWYSDTDCSLSSTGSANAYVVAANNTVTALADNTQLCFQANFANTGAATLQVDSLTAKTIKKKHDQDLASGDIEANQIVVVAYNATDDTFELISNVANGDLGNVVEDTTPQLGGDLDANTFNILMDSGSSINDESDNEVIYISSESSAINFLGVQNSATGNDVVVYSSGGDSNVNIDIQTQGSGTLQYNGTEVAVVGSSGITLGTLNTTTDGIAITFGSIPSGKKRIILDISNLSTSGTDPLVFTLGDSGGLETSGYGGYLVRTELSSSVTNSSNFALNNASVAASTYHVRVTLDLINAAAFTWHYSAIVIASDTKAWIGSGSKSLSAELTQLSLTTSSASDTFDINSGVNIQYE